MATTTRAMSSAPVASFRGLRADWPLAGQRGASAPRVSPSALLRRTAASAALAWLMFASFAHASPSDDVDAAERLQALDCARVSARDVAGTLTHFSAPRIVALQGSVPIVTMAPLLAFFEAMGYPAERVVQSGPNPRSRSSFVDARRIAGELAWHYEREALVPMLIGHSQGGMIVVKLLHELADARTSA